ncbi:MAG: MarR family transcriptional regulator [Candidatus Acidiferrum sp.]
MRGTINDSEYVALAEFRYRIREFLSGSDGAADSAGLEPQQYQMLLAIRGLPSGTRASIRELADRLLLRHHSAVGLIDRLEARGYVRRTHSARDQRQVCVTLLPRGRRALEQVVRQRLHELRGSGQALIVALTSILKHSRAIARSQRRLYGTRVRGRKDRIRASSQSLHPHNPQ